MENIIDARGLSCPQPVLMILNEIKKDAAGPIVVMVDSDASKENVVRSAQSKNWSADVEDAGAEGFRITLTRN
jgi:TusA-related sulfurtransferase